jgi:hypothetical protein
MQEHLSGQNVWSYLTLKNQVVFNIITVVKQLRASTYFGINAAVPDLNNELYQASCHRQSESICLYRVSQKPLDIITVATISSIK